jgi:ribonuclease P protein component
LAILGKLKIQEKNDLESVSRSRFVKKSRFVSIRWITGREQAFGYGVGISAKVVSRASKRNRIKRIIIEWLNSSCIGVNSGTILFVSLLKTGEEGEILEDLKSVIKNTLNV